MAGFVRRRNTARLPVKGQSYIALLASLSQSGFQTENNAAYQVIYDLIQGVAAHQTYIDQQLNDITRALVGAGIAININGTITANNFSGSSSGDNTGDVTLAGLTYLSINKQILTANLISPVTDIDTFNPYTPTITPVTNLDAVTAFSCQYLRIANRCIVSGHLSADPTAPGQVQLGISLPVASNLANIGELAGTAFCPTIAGQGAAIYADTGNDRAMMEWVGVDVSDQPMYFTFLYRII